MTTTGYWTIQESPACFFANTDWNTEDKTLYTRISSELFALAPNNNFGKLTDDVDNVAAIQFVTATAQSQLNKELFKVQFSSPLRLDAWYIQKNSATQISGGNVMLQGSNDNSVWTDLWSAPANPANAANVVANGGQTLSNSNKFTVSQNAAAYRYYRIYGVAAANVQSGTATEMYFDVNNGSYQASNFPETNCTNDPDGDGKSNHQDTNSDGDTCSDAFEAGATTTNSASYTFSGPYGANGLANSLETSSESGVLNYTSIYTIYATDPDVSYCTDSDGDGIVDEVDLDDDNDGVPDAVECGGSNIGVTPDDWFFNGSASYAANEYTLTTASNNQTGAIWNKNRLDLRESWEAYFELYLGNNDNGADGIAFVLQDKGIDPPLLSGGGLGYSGLFNSVAVEFDDFNNGTAWGDLADDHVAIHRNEVTNIAAGPVALPNIEDGAWHTALVAWESSTNTMTITFDGVQRIVYSEDFVSTVFGGDPVVHFGLTAATGAAVNLQKYRNLSMTVTCTSDTDGDGIVNYLDTDSDGDGCSDAFEAGATTDLTPNYTFPGPYGGNGLANSLETGPETGVVNYATSYGSYALAPGINQCSDSDNDMSLDYVDIDDDNDGVLDANESPQLLLWSCGLEHKRQGCACDRHLGLPSCFTFD
jgi:hypothetical protein